MRATGGELGPCGRRSAGGGIGATLVFERIVKVWDSIEAPPRVARGRPSQRTMPAPVNAAAAMRFAAF